VLIDLGNSDEAQQTFERALALEPDMLEARYGLGSGALLNLCYRPEVSAAALFDAHRRWGDALIAQQADTSPVFANTRDPERRLRIGYVSPDFHQHSTNHYFGPLLAHHDRQAFEIFLYGEVREPDAVTKHFQELAPHWRSTVGLGDAELRRQVLADRIDILIDLAGHTGSTRLAAFAVKPAPVTATWLGYPGTTGLSTIDYRLTDAHADPPGIAEQQHTEKLLRMPHCFLCYGPPSGLPPVAPSPALSRGAITFGSFNNLAKITPTVLETWAEILRGVPGSRLLMKGKLLADPLIRRRITDVFAAGGIESDRLDLRGLIPDAIDHLSLYREVDIGLDPFPYNGTTTTSEAMWMGVPVVTLIGDHHVARVGLSLLIEVGLGHLAALDRTDYVRIATELAQAPDTLNTLRLSLRDRFRASPHGDAPGFARDFETALRGAWRRWCEGEA
jgi:predicted O-linked N-acetylglucosamine transferase (SPINDLY family)